MNKNSPFQITFEVDFHKNSTYYFPVCVSIQLLQTYISYKLLSLVHIYIFSAILLIVSQIEIDAIIPDSNISQPPPNKILIQYYCIYSITIYRHTVFFSEQTYCPLKKRCIWCLRIVNSQTISSSSTSHIKQLPCLFNKFVIRTIIGRNR